MKIYKVIHYSLEQYVHMSSFSRFFIGSEALRFDSAHMELEKSESKEEFRTRVDRKIEELLDHGVDPANISWSELSLVGLLSTTIRVIEKK